jgi:hypothetical protein
VKLLARILLDAAAILSGLLFVILAVIWVRSHYAWDSIAFWQPGSEVGYEFTTREFGAAHGEISISRYDWPTGEHPGSLGIHWTRLDPSWFSPRTESSSFRFVRRQADWRADEHAGVRGWETTFPAWFGCLLASMLPAFWTSRWFRKRRRRNRLQSGHCVVCGYDLRGSKERCPECGTPITSAPKSL